MSGEKMRKLVARIYDRLGRAAGPRHWWPGETRDEIVIGAVLTQNTSWKNVEKAILNLKAHGLCDLRAIAGCTPRQIAPLIRSSGYFNLKAKRLHAVASFFAESGMLEGGKSGKATVEALRERILNVHGVGPETADSILLYALDRLTFVVDAYTTRVMTRHGLCPSGASYETLRGLLQDAAPRSVRDYNEFHALFVWVGHHFCKPRPACEACPLLRRDCFANERAWKKMRDPLKGEAGPPGRKSNEPESERTHAKMELDPQVKVLLEKLAAVPPINTMPPAQARFVFEATGPTLDLKDVPIAKSEDRDIPGPGGKIPVRIYTPETLSSSPAPAVLFFHGGGFVIGGRKTHDAPCRFLANHAGAIVVSVDYRLAPEHKFPAAVEDSIAALGWLRASAGELGIDPGRIAVAGDSAGGNLSAVVALADRDAGGAPPLKLQCLIYPVTDGTRETESRRLFAKGYFLESELMDWFFAQYSNAPTDREDWRLSPLLAPSHARLPRALVVTADFDPLRDEGKAYADKLAASGVKVEHRNYRGLVHGFFNMGGVIPAARTGVEEICEWIKSNL